MSKPRKLRRRTTSSKRRRARSTLDGRSIFRLTAVAMVFALLVMVVPPARAAIVSAYDMVVAASIAAREVDTRRARIARAALHYRISVELAADIQQAAVAEGIDPELAFRLVRVESGFRESAESPVGALGLAQLMPATAAELQPGITREEILSRETNLRLGFRYLHWLLTLYDGRLDDALHAYNRGPGTVARIRAGGGDPANGYAERVLGSGRDAYTGTGLIPAPVLSTDPS